MAMKIQFNFAALRRTSWQDYALRFLLGGAITVAAGIVAGKFGPAVGGLFLAFPAIFPAGATLIEKEERQKKERAGRKTGHRGQDIVALDAQGAAMGTIGLIVFALVVYFLLPHHRLWMVLAISTVAWLLVSITIWRVVEAV